MLRSLIIFITLIFLVSCSSGINNIKKQYYNIDIINGIDKDEAITTALYHVLLDKRFKTSSVKSISSTVTDIGLEWEVSLSHKSNNTKIYYLVDKKSGNATSQFEKTAPINFTSSFVTNPVNIKITPLEHRTLSQPTKLQKKENITFETKEEPVKPFRSQKKAAKPQKESSMVFSTPKTPAPADDKIFIDTEEPTRAFDNSNRETKSQERSTIAFNSVEELPKPSNKPRKNEGPLFIDAFPSKNKQQDEEIVIDSEAPARSFNLPDETIEESKESAIAFSDTVISEPTDKEMKIDTEERVRSFDLPDETKENEKGSVIAFSDSVITEPANTEERIQSFDLPDETKENEKGSVIAFSDSVITEPANTEERIQSFDPSDETKENEKGSVIAFSDTVITEPTEERINIDAEELISVLSSNSRISSRKNNLPGEQTAPKPTPKPTSKKGRKQDAEMATILDDTAQDTAQDTASTEIAIKSSQERQQTSAVSDNPGYTLKLLTGGFEADFNNHITLKPDHDMDFSKDNISDEIAKSENNVSDEIAKEAMQRIVSPPEPLGEFEAQRRPEIENEAVIQPTPRAELAAEKSPQIASLSRKTTVDNIIKSNGDTITFRGATQGNKGILKIMDDTVIDGYRTKVTAYKLNGIEIAQAAKFIELPEGNYTLISRCVSTFDQAYDEGHISFENKMKLTITDAHEYILEAQTYRFKGNVECAASIFDIRDTR